MISVFPPLIKAIKSIHFSRKIPLFLKFRNWAYLILKKFCHYFFVFLRTLPDH